MQQGERDEGKGIRGERIKEERCRFILAKHPFCCNGSGWVSFFLLLLLYIKKSIRLYLYRYNKNIHTHTHTHAVLFYTHPPSTAN